MEILIWIIWNIGASQFAADDSTYTTENVFADDQKTFGSKMAEKAGNLESKTPSDAFDSG